MNCDEFLEALVSTDSRQRTAAQAHANDCPACAELAEIHVLLKSGLGAGTAAAAIEGSLGVSSE